MDAVEFLKEYRRMCKKYAYMESGGEDCFYKCAFYGKHCNLACNDIDAKEAVSRVEQWAQTHPQKTMIQDFFEKFPNAPKHKNGCPKTCPDNIYNCKPICTNECVKCWSHPLEE